MAHGIKKINEWIMKDGRTINLTQDISPERVEGGTLYIKPLDGDLKFLKVDNTARKSWERFNPNIIFSPGSINSIIIGDSQITTPKLKDGCVTTPKLGQLAVTNEKLSNLSVSATKLQSNSVISEKILNGAVIESKLAPNSVTESKIMDRNVTTSKIKEGDIINNHIHQNTIKNDKLFDETIEFNKIKPYTIHGGQTFPYSENQTKKGQIAQASITDWNLKDSACIERVIASNAVTHTKIKDGSVYDRKIPDSAIKDRHISELNGRKLLDLSVDDTKLMNNSVITSKILNLAVTKAKLAGDIQVLMDEWIRVKDTQTIHGAVKDKSAWVKGDLIVRDPSNLNGNVKLEVQGTGTFTGDLTAARCFNPVFADIAEGYVPREIIEPGEPVALCKEGGLQVEHLNKHNYSRFLGFASDEYATLFGATSEEISNGEKIAVTLTGRIKVKLPDLEAAVGDYLCYIDGSFVPYKRRHVDAIGRVLENTKKGQEYVLCQLWA